MVWRSALLSHRKDALLQVLSLEFAGSLHQFISLYCQDDVLALTQQRNHFNYLIKIMIFVNNLMTCQF